MSSVVVRREAERFSFHQNRKINFRQRENTHTIPLFLFCLGFFSLKDDPVAADGGAILKYHRHPRLEDKNCGNCLASDFPISQCHCFQFQVKYVFGYLSNNVYRTPLISEFLAAVR